MWKEPRQMDLRKHVCDVAPSYSTQRLNQVKDLVLPLIDDMVQPASLLQEKVPTEVEILRPKIEAERKGTNLKILRLQEDQWDTEILQEDFKKLGLENEKLKKGTNGKASNPRISGSF